MTAPAQIIQEKLTQLPDPVTTEHALELADDVARLYREQGVQAFSYSQTCAQSISLAEAKKVYGFSVKASQALQLCAQVFAILEAKQKSHPHSRRLKERAITLAQGAAAGFVQVAQCFCDALTALKRHRLKLTGQGIELESLQAAETAVRVLADSVKSVEVDFMNASAMMRAAQVAFDEFKGKKNGH